MAAPTQLNRLDKIQRWYLHELNLTDTEAFVNFNFAPPSLRRAIGMLGFLHKRVLNQCHPVVREVLPRAVNIDANYHTKALDPHTALVRYNDRLFNRSLYGYILMYNKLPQELVNATSVQNFQSRLTHLAKQRANIDDANWRESFRDCRAIHEMFYARRLD